MQTSQSTSSLSLAELWTITEIRRQINYVLTDVLLYSFLKSIFLIVKKTRTRERELIIPFNFQGLLSGF